MMGRSDDFSAIRAALTAHTADLAQHLLGEPNARLSSKRELRFGRKGSTAVTIAGPKAGTGTGGDMFALIMRERGGGFADALEFASRFGCGDFVRRSVERPAGDDAKDAATQLRKARSVWSQGRPINGTPAETYLRGARGYDGPIPASLRYLPAHDQHKHAVVCAFGIPDEIEPGILRFTHNVVLGVHIIRLNADGSDRARHTSGGKITLGRCTGTPIVCAPFHDSNSALLIAEGVEDALSAAAAMGIGAWAAGGASRMPALAETVPSYADCVTICVDDDEAGRLNSVKLARRLRERGFEVRLMSPFLQGGAR